MPAHLDPVDPGHHHIEDRQVELLAVEHRDRLGAVGRLSHLESFHAEIQPDDVQQARFVVSEKDALLGQRLRPPGRVDRCVIAVSSAEWISISPTIVPSPGGDKCRRARSRTRLCWMMCSWRSPRRAASRRRRAPVSEPEAPHRVTPRMLTEPRRPARIRALPLGAPWLAVGTVCVGAFMGQLDASIVTTALPVIRINLHASIASVEWVVLVYVLVLAGTVAAVGRIADRVGRKLLYTYGFGIFVVGSAACALAPSLGLLVSRRLVQAVGAVMLQANSYALIRDVLPPTARHRPGYSGRSAGRRAVRRAGARRGAHRARRLAAHLSGQHPARR